MKKTRQNQLFTDKNIGIDERIAKGKTFITQKRDLANNKAKEMGSYVYNAYERKKGHLSFWGFAVPKIIVLFIALSFASCCSADDDLREPKIVSFECDTQDNIIRLSGVWVTNIGDDGEKSSSVGFWRISPTFKIQSDDEITSLELHKFNYDYYVNFIDPYNVEIYSDYWEEYFLNTDVVSITILILK